MSDWNENVVDEFRRNGCTVTTIGFGRGLVLFDQVIPVVELTRR